MASSAIIIVNWNGWEDTVRCIAACEHLIAFDGSVLVIDNGSTDKSFDSMLAWARNEMHVSSTAENPEIAALEERPADSFLFAACGTEQSVAEEIRLNGLLGRGLYFVRSDKNLGFGGGNNIGLRLAMSDAACALFWLINSDAIPQAQAFNELFAVCGQIQEPIVSGSVILNYDRPHTIQALGSRVSYLTLHTGHEFANEAVDILDSFHPIYETGAPIGAAMAINRAFIEAYGLFDERIFLYYEEQDLVSRLPSRKSFVCTRSKVYHKGGQATKAGKSVHHRAKRADQEFMRAKGVLARKIGWPCVVSCANLLFISILRRIMAGRLDLAKGCVHAFLSGILSVR